MISHGSEGECPCLMFTKECCSTVHFSMVVKMLYSHGSEGFYYLRFLILKKKYILYNYVADVINKLLSSLMIIAVIVRFF